MRLGRISSIVGVLLVACVAACSSQKPASSRPVHPLSGSPATAKSTRPHGDEATQSAPPTTVPPIPSGIYRQKVSQDDVLSSGGDDLGDAGTWTITVRDDHFQLECRPITDPGDDCGHHVSTSNSYPYLVEIGTLRGDDRTMWIVEDGALRARLTACVRHSYADIGCGAEDPYRLTWKRTDTGLEFSNFVGLGDQALTRGAVTNWTMVPWTKIA